MKKVLYISYDGMTDNLGQSQVIPYLKGLSKLGHKFTILSCEKEKNFNELSERNKAIFKEYDIDWHYVMYTKKPPVLSTVYDLWRMNKKVDKILKEKDIDVVHSRTIVPALAAFGPLKKHGAKFLLDTRSFWVDERVEGDLWDLKNPLFRMIFNFWKKKENMLFHGADHLITLTEVAKDYIHKSYGGNGLPEKRIEVIPCCADLDHFSRSNIDQNEVDRLRSELGIKESEYILTYLGSLGTRYMLTEMVDFYKVMWQKMPESRFLFITRDMHDTIRDLMQEAGIPDDRLIIHPSTYKDIPNAIALSDVSVFFIKTGFSGKAVSPTKQAELLGLGIPIVCNPDIGDTGAILTKTNSGVVVNEFTEAEYSSAAKKLIALAKDRTNIRNAAEEYFSVDRGIKSYNRVYEII